MKSKNKKGEFSWGDMPNEVFWAKTVGMQPDGSGGWIQMIGMSTLEKIKEIRKKYPDWFPWETKYDSIPKEVHEAYEKEAHPDKNIFDASLEINTKGIDSPPWRDEQIEHTPLTIKDIEDVVKALDDAYKEDWKRREKDRMELKRIRKIWNKHYGKYGLKYRE